MSLKFSRYRDPVLCEHPTSCRDHAKFTRVTLKNGVIVAQVHLCHDHALPTQSENVDKSVLLGGVWKASA